MTNLRDFIRTYAFERYMQSWVIACIDVVISIVAFALSFICIAALSETINLMDMLTIKNFMILLAISTVSAMITILAMKTHRIIIRHAMLADMGRLVMAVVVKEIVCGIALFALNYMPAKIVTILLLLDMVIFYCGLCGVRILMIVVYESLKQVLVSSSKRKNIFIFGTNDKSTALRTRLLNSPHYKVVGFLKELTSQKIGGNTLSGLTVFGFANKNDIHQLVAKNRVQAILFPTYEALRAEQERLVKICSALKIQILIAPPIDEIIDGKIMQSSIREIKIEDLLGRDEIKISIDEIVANFKGKSILVTGAAGSIGSELCRQLASFGVGQLVMFDNAETPMHYIRLELEERFRNVPIIPIIGDVRLEQRLRFAFEKYHPQVVFHAAAYKHVPLMEENPCEAVYVNVIGTRNIAELCVEYGTEMMVMISTDKAVNPTNVMGCSKRLAEIYVQSLGKAISDGKVKCKGETKTKFVTTRFGNVLGSNGSVIPRFREQIMKGGPVTVTHPDITRFFMTIPEACRLVMEAATMSCGNQIFVFDMGKSVKIVDLARRMIELAGFKVGKDIKIEFTGLRPGEKLYEEVLSNEENTTKTDHEKIRIAIVREYDYNEAVNAVGKLKELAIEVRITDLVKKMKEIVPEYKSKNSRFEELDK